MTAFETIRFNRHVLVCVCSQKRLRRYLQRSLVPPLSIGISLTGAEWPLENELPCNSLIALTALELSRWETLAITFEDVEETDGGVG
jgi:hypothetical protein